ALRVGTIRAVARGRGVDQGGLASAREVVAEAELVHDPRAEVLRHYFGAIDELEGDLSALGRFQIEGDAALVAIGAYMHHARPLVPDIPAAPVPLPSPLGALDCNDVGAEVSERLDAHGAEQEMVEARPLHRATPRSFCSMSPCQIWTRSCAQMRLELKELRLRV